MSSAKNVVVIGLTGKIETTYNAGSSHSLAGPDSIKPAEFVNVAVEYAFDGARAISPGTFGTNRRVAPSGRTVNFTLPVEGKGRGTAYTSSSDTIPSMQNLLLACGLSGSMGANSWSFSPAPQNVTPVSLGLELFSKGERLQVSGAYASFVVGTDSAAPPLFEYAIQGTAELPTDFTFPSVVYEADSVQPPNAEPIQLDVNLGGSVTTLKVRSFNFDLQREISPRLDINASSGHAGFAVARRNPRLVVVVEEEALSTLNPESLWSVGTNGTVNMIIGSSAGNIWKLALNQAQVVGVVPGEDGSAATWELTFDAYPSDSNTDDDFNIYFY